MPPEVSEAAEYFQTRTREDFQDLLATLTRPVGAASPMDPHSITETPDGLDIRCSGRCYELRAITKPGPDRLRATVKALGEHGRFVIDTVDFYHARTRRSFLCEAARLWRQPLEAVEADLNRLTAELEGLLIGICFFGVAGVCRAGGGHSRRNAAELSPGRCLVGLRGCWAATRQFRRRS